MALSKLSGDEQGIIFVQLCNVLDPRVAVDFSSASGGLRLLTQALLQQLRADHEVAAALCLKVGMQSCKKLREAKIVLWHDKGLSVADLFLLGTLGSVLPALEMLVLIEPAAGPGGLERLAEGLGAGALPAVTTLALCNVHVGDAGASALAAALGRGALPRLKVLFLANAAIGDAGLVALAPALQQMPALENLELNINLFGDEGLAALVPPPPPAGAPSPSTGVLAKLKTLKLEHTQISETGCAALVVAIDSGALPALEEFSLEGSLASDAAEEAVYEAVVRAAEEAAVVAEAAATALRAAATALRAAAVAAAEAVEAAAAAVLEEGSDAAKYYDSDGAEMGQCMQCGMWSSTEFIFCDNCGC